MTSNDDDLKLDSSVFLSKNHIPKTLTSFVQNEPSPPSSEPAETIKKTSAGRGGLRKKRKIKSNPGARPKKYRNLLTPKTSAYSNKEGKTYSNPTRIEPLSCDPSIKLDSTVFLSKNHIPKTLTSFAQNELSPPSSELAETIKKTSAGRGGLRKKRKIKSNPAGRPQKDRNLLTPKTSANSNKEGKTYSNPTRREPLSCDPSILTIGNDLTISRVTTDDHKPTVTSGDDPQMSSVEVTWQEIPYNCDILLNHCRWCGCSTPRLHTYLTIKHRCNSFCTNVQNTTIELRRNYKSQIAHLIEASKDFIEESKMSSSLESLPEVHKRPSTFKSFARSQSKRASLSEDILVNKGSQVRSIKRSRGRPRSRVSCKSPNINDEMESQEIKLESRKNKKNSKKLQTKEILCCPSEPTDVQTSFSSSLWSEEFININDEPQTNLNEENREFSDPQNEDLYEENLKSIFGKSASLTVIPWQSKKHPCTDVKPKRKRGRPRKSVIKKEITEERFSKKLSPNDLQEEIPFHQLSEQKLQSKSDLIVKQNFKQLIEENVLGENVSGFCSDSNDSKNVLENLVRDVEYVVVSDETILSKEEAINEITEGQSGKCSLRGASRKDNPDKKYKMVVNSEGKCTKFTSSFQGKSKKVNQMATQRNDKMDNLSSKSNPKKNIRCPKFALHSKISSCGDQSKALSYEIDRIMEDSNRIEQQANEMIKKLPGIKMPKSSHLRKRRGRSKANKTLVTNAISKEKTAISKEKTAFSEENPKSGKNKLYINTSPSVRDIFGDLPIKEEPEDSPAEGDILAQQFNTELMTLVSGLPQGNNNNANDFSKKICMVDPVVTNFKGLLREDSFLTRDVNSLVKNEPEENLEDGPESPRPLQIDEDYVAPAGEIDAQSDGAGEFFAHNSSIQEGPNGGGNNHFIKTMADENLARKRKKKKKIKNKVGHISYITPLKFKISLNSSKKSTSSEAPKIHPLPLVKLKKEPALDWLSENYKIPDSSVSDSKLNLLKEPNKENASGSITNLKGSDESRCCICQIKFDGFLSLADHLEQHQKDGLILCFYCQKSFGDKTSMKRHMRTHTGERPYQCKICFKRFSLPGNFKKHRDIHEDIRTEPCSICGKTFRRKEHLKYHMRTHTGEKPFKCTRCGSCFTARYSLQIHMNIHLGRKPYKCSYCAKGFADKSTMRKHIRVHTGEKPFSCSHCLKSFCESGTLAAHMATHMSNRPFSCTQCQFTFKTSGGLRQHQKVHFGDKQFSCKYCGMRFLLKYNMTMHERIHTGEKPYKCSHCERSFRSRSCLGKHIVLHGGEEEKKYQCGHCDKKFHRRAHLRRHEYMHLGIKPHKCDKCPKGFCTKNTLRRHKLTFHSEGARKFPCESCGKIFKRRIYVMTHLCTGRPGAIHGNEDGPVIKDEPEEQDTSC